MNPRPLLLLLLAIVPATPIQTHCTNVDPCLLSCEGCTGLTTIPDPLNCRRFYYCDEDQLMTDDPFDCPDGQVYNADTHECEIDPEWLDCTPPCVQTAGACHYTCQSGDAEVASLYDCNTYYICDADGNTGSAQSCPAEAPYFDGATCQTEEANCCNCHAYCFPGDEGRLVVDPLDCRKYHVCVTEGAPANSGTCDNGEYFDPVSRQCSTEAPCRTMCRNVVGADGCIDLFTCTEDGRFAKCPTQCVPEYYYCTTPSDDYIEETSCSSNYVFNPETGSCTSESSCHLRF